MNTNKSSRLSMYLPNEYREALDSVPLPNGMAHFIRTAIAEKLLRDFDIVVRNVRPSERTDLINPDEATRAKMRSQAAHARKFANKPK